MAEEQQKVIYIISTTMGVLGGLVAVKIFKDEYKKEIADEPEKWLFFVEGGVLTPDRVLLIRFARRYGIEVFDPIIPPYDSEVIEQYSKETGISKPILTYLTTEEEPELTEEEIKQIRLLDLEKFNHRLIDISNTKSRKILEEIISKYPTKRFFVCYLGKMHEPILKSLKSFKVKYV